uniref:Histone chaperone domain-containing protein n=1 Tax=Kalanchoe fedtschenkoi TaxID=63787 RepID=A0A7N0TSC2_KALFE
MACENGEGDPLETLESKIASALDSREEYLKKQADFLSMEKVRRLLETDLGMEKFALDEQKRFIKQRLYKLLGVTGDAVESGLKTEIGDNDASRSEGGATDSVNGAQLEKYLDEPDTGKDNITDDSPVLGLVSGNEKTDQRIRKAQGKDINEKINESIVKEALMKRTDYFRTNLDNVTMAGVRRLLEDDLKLDTYCLDPFKKFINGELDEILKHPPVSKAQSDKKKSTKNAVSKEASKAVSNESNSNSSDSNTQASSEEADASSEKRIVPKGETGKKQLLPGLKKRKLTMKGTMGSRKRSKSQENENSDPEVDRKSSKNDDSQSPAVKNKSSINVFGKRVEHLKSIIKSCGIRIPPVIYKRAKQAPENEREFALINGLVEILSKEGLTANPSEKGLFYSFIVFLPLFYFVVFYGHSLIPSNTLRHIT